MTDAAAPRPEARAPRGFADRRGRDLIAERRIVEAVAPVYERWGFEPLATPAFEYAEALGKFLPDADRPNAGVFALQDDDDQWMALRYDLTAPLARYVAGSPEGALPRPFRRYAFGPVWRNEKPGPGRFREFVQCDADTVGSDRPEADAEIIAMASEGLQAAGLGPGQAVIRISSRQLVNGVLQAAGVRLLSELPPEGPGDALMAFDPLPAPPPRADHPTLVAVSHEMSILRGARNATTDAVPVAALVAVFDTGAETARLTLAGSDRVAELLDGQPLKGRVILLLAPAVVDRIGGATLPAPDAIEAYYLPAELCAIVMALRDCARIGQAAEIYIGAKGIELAYETWARLDDGALTALAADGELSCADSRRIAAARRVIDDRWREKLSLDQLAAQCGLNREKLTRGFRQMFACSVGEALAERRLTEASRMLLTTDLPVSSVGYRNGYDNNASFARAFGRRFGVSPSDFRARRLAA